jgi:hypothetical protein
MLNLIWPRIAPLLATATANVPNVAPDFSRHQYTVNAMVIACHALGHYNPSGFQIVRMLLDVAPGLVNTNEQLLSHPFYGTPPLASAVHYLLRSEYQRAPEHGHERLIQMMLERRADPDVLFENRSSRPLLIAVLDGGNLAVIQQLLDAGADPNAQCCRRHFPENSTISVEGVSLRVKVNMVRTPMSVSLDIYHNLRGILDLLRHGGDPDAAMETHYCDANTGVLKKVENKADCGEESFLRRCIAGFVETDRNAACRNIEMCLILLVCFGAKLSGQRKSHYHVDPTRSFQWNLLTDLKRLRQRVQPPCFGLLLWFMEMADAMDRGEFPTGTEDARFPLDPQPDFYRELGQLAPGVDHLRSAVEEIAPRPLPRLLLFPAIAPFLERWRPKEAPLLTYWVLKPSVQAVVCNRVRDWMGANMDWVDRLR